MSLGVPPRLRPLLAASLLWSLPSVALPACFVDDLLAFEPVDAGVDAPRCAAAVDCDDHNPCTADDCTSGACTHADVPTGTSCGDGDLCHGVSACDGAGTCSTGTPPVIDDGNPCTADACDPLTGMVTHTITPGCVAPLAHDAAPAPRTQHTAVWTGASMLVWGGSVPGTPAVTATGGRYDPVANAWSPMSTIGAPAPRHSHCAVWTGKRMIVWGGYGVSALETTGGAYDPAADAWTPLANTGAPAGRIGFSCVWTGAELVVWGGTAGAVVLASGGRYDPLTDLWKPLPSGGAPSPRYNHSAVWSGTRMIVWGGNDLFNWHQDGVSFDPAASAWTGPTPTAGAPAAREQHTAVWTGSSMVVWGGFSGGPYLGDGGSLDPAGAAWTALSVTGAPSPRTEHAAVWTGDRMVVWGGCGTDSCKQLYGDGGAWKPGANGGSWQAIAATPGVVPRRGPTAVWTGTAALLWGGKAAQGETDTGAIYYP